MEQLNWNDIVFSRIVKLIEENGKHSKNYNSDNPPYVIFDFDNTSAFNDVQEALLIYQLIHLRFKFTPSELVRIFKTNIPDTKKTFAEKFNSLQNTSVNVDIIVKDISDAYTYLFNNFEDFNNGGKLSLSEIQKTSPYQAFLTKVRYLYEAINHTFDSSFGYPWITYLFTGMTSEEVQKITIESNDYWLKQKQFSKTTWKTPDNFKGETGVISIDYKTGIDFPIEMQNLYTYFQKNGIIVYICSASFIDVIKATANTKKYGYNVPEENVFAMELMKNSEEKFINCLDNNYFQTQEEGKTKTINTFIKPKHQNEDPIFIAGDSYGDYSMLTSFKNLKLGLILDRNKEEMLELVKKDNRFVLQARNENTGRFIKSERSVLLK